MTWKKIEPKDERNYSPVYWDVRGDSFMICGDSLGEPDPYKMVVMEKSQIATVAVEFALGERNVRKAAKKG